MVVFVPGTAQIGFTQNPVNVRVTEYPIPVATSSLDLRGITMGADNAVWFTLFNEKQMGRIDPTGSIGMYPCAETGGFTLTGSCSPGALVTGSGGALWFLTGSPSGVGVGTFANGTVSSEFVADSRFGGLTAGQDGTFWFAGAAGISRITSSGTATKYPDNHGILSAATAADGSIWFTAANSILRITPGVFPAMGQESQFAVPGAGSAQELGAIAQGPDGGMWFLEQNCIGRIDNSGNVRTFIAPATIPLAGGITRGPDGAMWFTTEAAYIGRIDTEGNMTFYPTPSVSEGPITPGPDGNLWYAEFTGSGGSANIAKVQVLGNLVFPYFEAGGHFTTAFYVVNIGSQTENFSVSFYGDDGSPVLVPYGASAVSQLTGSIPAGGSAYYEIGTPSVQVVEGSAVVSADPSVVVQGLIRRLNSSGTSDETAMSPTTGVGEFAFPFDSTQDGSDQIHTWVAVANLETGMPANFTCTARDSQGNLVPNGVSIPTLNPRGHWSGDHFPLLKGKRGTIDCVSNNARVGAVAIRRLGNLTTILSVVPVKDVRDLPPVPTN